MGPSVVCRRRVPTTSPRRPAGQDCRGVAPRSTAVVSYRALRVPGWAWTLARAPRTSIVLCLPNRCGGRQWSGARCTTASGMGCVSEVRIPCLTASSASFALLNCSPGSQEVRHGLHHRVTQVTHDEVAAVCRRRLPPHSSQGLFEPPGDAAFPAWRSSHSGRQTARGLWPWRPWSAWCRKINGSRSSDWHLLHHRGRGSAGDVGTATERFIFVATSGCTWRQLPLVRAFRPDGRRAAPSARGSGVTKLPRVVVL